MRCFGIYSLVDKSERACNGKIGCIALLRCLERLIALVGIEALTALDPVRAGFVELFEKLRGLGIAAGVAIEVRGDVIEGVESAEVGNGERPKTSIAQPEALAHHIVNALLVDDSLFDHVQGFAQMSARDVRDEVRGVPGGHG